MKIITLLFIVAVSMLLFFALLKSKRKFLIALTVVIVVIFGGGYLLLNLLGKAFGAKCTEEENWNIEGFTIIHKRCIGFAGPHYDHIELFDKDDFIASGSRLNENNCLIQFKGARGDSLLFDVCEGKLLKDYSSFIKIDNPEDCVFDELGDYPRIKDTSSFVSKLKRCFHPEIDENSVQQENERISAYQKIRIYGSKKEYYLIEYDYITGANASFPWKVQFILNSEGKLIKQFSALRYELLPVFPNQSPCLLILNVTSKGNGGHEIYRFTSDTLENIYEGYYDFKTRTYDAHEDMSVFEPNELSISLKDENRDGFNDLLFSGHKLMLGKYSKDSLWYDVEGETGFSVENTAAKLTVKYVFLYDIKSGHFKSEKKRESIIKFKLKEQEEKHKH